MQIIIQQSDKDLPIADLCQFEAQTALELAEQLIGQLCDRIIQAEQEETEAT